MVTCMMSTIALTHMYYCCVATLHEQNFHLECLILP